MKVRFAVAPGGVAFDAPRFVELHRAIWDVLRDEVLRGYQQQLRKTA